MNAPFSEKAGEALLKAVEDSRQQANRRRRFQDWLGAYTLAAHIVESLARRPGLRDAEGAVIREAFHHIAQAAERAYQQIKKKLEHAGVSLADPGHQMQVKRLVFEAVAREWPDDPREPPALFRSMPGRGDQLTHDFAIQSLLLQGYLCEVTELIETAGESLPGERALAEDYHLDRLLAAHSMYLRCHDAVVPFFDAHLRDQPPEWRVLLGGAPARRATFSATDLVHRIVAQAILPIVDERHAHLLTLFDPQSRLGSRDRHFAYRALITNITGDAVSALATQRDDLLEECEGRYEQSIREPDSHPPEVLAPWLSGQINYRLDRVYPRPDEYLGAGGMF